MHPEGWGASIWVADGCTPCQKYAPLLDVCNLNLNRQSVHILVKCILVTARVVKQAKVMFSQSSVCLMRGRWTVPKVNHPPSGRVKGHNSSPLTRVKGHNTSPWPWSRVITPPSGTMHRRAVRILLECILVLNCFSF